MDQNEFVKITSHARTKFGEFFEGETRFVPPEVKGHLVGSGWAEETEVVLEPHEDEVTPPPVTLEVDSSTIGTKTEEPM